jgi:hypothetical protein
MTKLRDNRAFQTVVGGAVLYLTFRLWQEGLFDRLLNKDDPEGFEGPEVWLAVGQALLSFVQLVGIITIGIVSGILPHLESMLEFLGKQLRGLFDKGKEFVAKNKDAQTGEQWNWKPLAAIVLSWFLYANGILGEAWEVIKDNITNEEVLRAKEDRTENDLDRSERQAGGTVAQGDRGSKDRRRIFTGNLFRKR